MAIMATGCTKESQKSSIRLLTEPMNFGGAKVLVDPTNINTIRNAEWVLGEQILLNGSAYPITERSSGTYYIELAEPINTALLGIYPTTLNSNGNDVTYNANTLTINSLNIDFRGSSHRIIFPMAAEAAAGSSSLKFDHLTGGLKLTLTDTSTARNYTLGSLRIVTYGNNATAATIAARHGITACWAKQGLTVPGGMVGQNGNSVDAKYASQMDFTLTTNGTTPGKAIPDGGSISICVPVTISSVKKLEVTGFGTDGTQLFSRMKEFGEAKTLEANHMYSIPEIQF